MSDGLEDYELYSIRQRRAANAGRADVYQYESLPARFRAQVIYIWVAAIGPWAEDEYVVYNYDEVAYSGTTVNPFWSVIFKQFTRENGFA